MRHFQLSFHPESSIHDTCLVGRALPSLPLSLGVLISHTEPLAFVVNLEVSDIQIKSLYDFK